MQVEPVFDKKGWGVEKYNYREGEPISLRKLLALGSVCTEQSKDNCHQVRQRIGHFGHYRRELIIFLNVFS